MDSIDIIYYHLSPYDQNSYPYRNQSSIISPVWLTTIRKYLCISIVPMYRHKNKFCLSLQMVENACNWFLRMYSKLGWGFVSFWFHVREIWPLKVSVYNRGKLHTIRSEITLMCRVWKYLTGELVTPPFFIDFSICPEPSTQSASQIFLRQCRCKRHLIKSLYRTYSENKCGLWPDMRVCFQYIHWYRKSIIHQLAIIFGQNG